MFRNLGDIGTVKNLRAQQNGKTTLKTTRTAPVMTTAAAEVAITAASTVSLLQQQSEVIHLTGFNNGMTCQQRAVYRHYCNRTAPGLCHAVVPGPMCAVCSPPGPRIGLWCELHVSNIHPCARDGIAASNLDSISVLLCIDSSGEVAV